MGEFKKSLVITAEEARKVTIDNRMGFDECMVGINDSANNGVSFFCAFKEIDVTALDKLMDMGYEVGSFRDSMNQSFLRITWK